MQLAIIKRDGKTIGLAEAAPQGIGLIEWFHRNCPAYSMDHATAHEGYSVEYVEGVDCRAVEALVGAICGRAGVTMEATFVPFSQSRNAKPGRDGKAWRSLNWRVTIKRHGRDVVTTDYAQGEGHAPAYKSKVFKFPTGKTDSWMRDKAIALECESGKETRGGLMGGTPYSSRTPIPAPSIGDVMQALASDADVLDAGGFEDWAADYGYDTDSRAAEATYRACIEIATKLRAGLGGKLLAEIRLAASFN